MTRRPFVRLALPTAALALVSACVVNLGFEMHKPFQLQSQQGSPAISRALLVDLSDYQEIQDHKSQIKSLDLDYADATVVTINAGNTAQKLNGSLVLRVDPNDTAHDVKVGDLKAFAVTPGATTRLNGTPELDAFLFQQFQSQGKFYAVVTGSVDGKLDIVLDVNMHASIGYDAGL